MNFSFDKFLKPLTSSDKNIKIYDNNNVIKYIINPFNVKTLNISNNLITINLESNRNIVLDFSTQNETKQAIQKLQIYVDTLKNSLVPYYIQHAVELEAPNFTKGPTGSIGVIGPIGPDGQKGDDGKSAYDVWLLSNSGTEQDFLTSLTGPIGPTGSIAFGDTDELLVTGQSINATVDNKDIEIVTKGSGNLLFRIDRDGWLINYGVSPNNVAEVWGSGSTLCDDGYIYTTGGDYTSFNTYVIKTATNGQLVWQKEISFYSSGECIIFKNGYLYLLVSDNSSYLSFGNMSILKMNTDGFIVNQWLFDLPSTTIPYGYEITVDEEDNVYYTGLQQNGSNYDLIMGKLNTTTSNIDWSYVVDGGLNFDDRGYSIKYKNGYVYILGTVVNEQSFIPRGDIFVAKYDKLGNKVWAKVIGNTNTYQEGLCITVDSDNFIYIGGYINFDPIPGTAPIGPFNNFFIKLDLNGNNVWSRSIDSFNRSIVSIEEDGLDNLYIISTQASTSTPVRASTDLYLSKIDKSNGSIVWQQYVGSPYRDSVWANIPDMYAAGHRTLAIDNIGKAIYITGLTKEGGNLYHNAFLMSYDQKSLPEGSYNNWVIQNATFSTIDSTFEYYNDTFNIPSITITNTLLDNTTQTVSIITGNTSSTINKDKEFILFSPNTELYVKGIITIDDLYTLPREAGSKGQILTYGESGSLLEWHLPTLTLTFNDIEYVENNIIGGASMSIYNDPINGPVDGNFDDETFEVSLPFDISFMGETYSTVYVSSNSFVTFGGVFSGLSGFSEKNPPFPGIFVDAGDRSIQKLYTKTTANQFIIRYEGNVLPSGTASSVEIEWEMTFNENSSELSVNIGNNDAYGTGFSVIKDSAVINTTINTSTNTAFKIIKGYGVRNVQANRVNYLNVEGLSYSVVEDALNLGEGIVNIDFSGLGGMFYYQSNTPIEDNILGIKPGTFWYDSDQGHLYVYVKDGNSYQWVTPFSIVGPPGPAGSDGSFTTLGSTGSNIFLDSNQYFHILSGIQNGNDQFLYTIESFGSDQGMYLQSKIPIMEDDQDQIRFGIKDSNGDWVYHVKLSHNTPSVGQMIIYDAYGNDSNNQVLDYSQEYVTGDILSIYIDGEKVYYKINGVTLVDGTTDFIILNPSLSYRFFCETLVGTNPSNALSMDYDFDNFKFYPIAAVSKSKNFLSTSTKTADYIITLDDYTIRVDATSNNVTITLPTVASSYSNGRGYEFVIKRVDNSVNNVYLNGNSGELIDTYTTNGLTFSSLETKKVQSNGINWDIL